MKHARQPYDNGPHNQQPYDNAPYNQQSMTPAQVRSHAAQHRRSSKAKRVGFIIGGIVLALVLVVGGFALWFVLSLNNSLAKNADDQALEALSKSVRGEPFYMLVMASDSRDGEHGDSVGQRTDVMLLVRIDMKNAQVTMLSIPRDTRAVLDDGKVVKMNELCYVGGAKKAIEGVSKLTGVPISHYAMVYMSDCKAVVDELGGVEINVPKEINNDDPETNENVNIQPGVQVLDGKQAQNFAISRHEADGNQDAYRQWKIRQLLEAIIKKVLHQPPLTIPGTVVNLAQYVQTDMRANDFIDLARGFANNPNGITVYQASGPSEGGIDEESKMWLCYENPEGWANVVSVMDSGGDPSTVTY